MWVTEYGGYIVAGQELVHCTGRREVMRNGDDAGSLVNTYAGVWMLTEPGDRSTDAPLAPCRNQKRLGSLTLP